MDFIGVNGGEGFTDDDDDVDFINAHVSGHNFVDPNGDGDFDHNSVDAMIDDDFVQAVAPHHESDVGGHSLKSYTKLTIFH